MLIQRQRRVPCLSSPLSCPRLPAAAPVLWCAALVACTSPDLFAKPPEVVLRVEINERPMLLPRAEMPVEAQAGDEVWFDVSASLGEPDRFYVTLDEFKPGVKQFDVQDQGRRLRLLSRPGTYHLRFLVSNPDGFDERRQTVVIRCDESEPRPTPTPAPAPSPAPDPKPQPLPGPKPDPFNIGKSVLDVARRINDPAGALALASKAQTLAERIRQGTLTDPQDVVNEIAAALKAAGPKWSALLTVTKTALQMLLATGQLSSEDVAPWATLLEVIAQALRDAAATR